MRWIKNITADLKIVWRNFKNEIDEANHAEVSGRNSNSADLDANRARYNSDVTKVNSIANASTGYKFHY